MMSELKSSEGKKPGIISWDILRRIEIVMRSHGIEEDTIDYVLKGVYVYGVPEGEESERCHI